MGQYEPKPLLSDGIHGLRRDIQEELRNVAVASVPDTLELAVRHSAPEKVFVGLIAYADGTHWNPGSGEGVYVYKSGGWTFVA